MAPVRHKRSCSFVSAIVILAMGAVLLCGATANAQDIRVPPDDDRSHEWALSHGGKLYDNWFATQLLEPPVDGHPSLPENAKIHPASSWRCVSCHGWDYRGDVVSGPAGQMRAPSLAAMRGVDQARIGRILRSSPHGFGASILPDDMLELVARFVSQGQHDLADYADPVTGAANGHPLDGRPIYQGVCISCHNVDGLAYIVGEPGDLPSLGWLARNRPAQVLHKIRNGQPGADMVQLRFLSNDQVSDLLAYLQTLPDR